jgi:hypothetical protein
MRHLTHAFVPALLASLLLLPLATAQTRTPSAVTNPVIEGKGDTNGVDDLYRFEAGPGDFTVTAEATTNYYSRQVEVKLIDASGLEAGSFTVVATDTTGRASRAFHTASHRAFTMSVHADRDPSIKSLDYRVTLGGSVDVAQPASSQIPTATAPTSDTVATPTTTPMTGGDPIALSFAQMVNGLIALPSTGTLRVEMKDGSVTVIDLSHVTRLTYVQH